MFPVSEHVNNPLERLRPFASIPSDPPPQLSPVLSPRQVLPCGFMCNLITYQALAVSLAQHSRDTVLTKRPRGTGLCTKSPISRCLIAHRARCPPPRGNTLTSRRVRLCCNRPHPHVGTRSVNEDVRRLFGPVEDPSW